MKTHRQDAFNEAVKVSTQEHQDSKKLVVIDFYAVWCGPCKDIAPKVDAFAKEYTGVSFYKLNVDDLQTLAAELRIYSMPSFVLYKNGVRVETVVGASPKALENALIKHGAIKTKPKIDEL